MSAFKLHIERILKVVIAAAFAFTGLPLQAQQRMVNPNDSLFSSRTLTSIQLYDPASNHVFKLPAAGSSGALRLFVFLSPECPICRNYTTLLNQMDMQYAGRIKMYGIVPGATWSREDINGFTAKYKIRFSVCADKSLSLSHYLQATITPEAILLDAQDRLVYKGAIDNWFRSLGKPGARATEHYLQDAIESALLAKIPPVKRTHAVGCLINDF